MRYVLKTLVHLTMECSLLVAHSKAPMFKYIRTYQIPNFATLRFLSCMDCVDFGRELKD